MKLIGTCMYVHMYVCTCVQRVATGGAELPDYYMTEAESPKEAPREMMR